MPIYLDTETTGLNPRKGDAIVEIAIVDEDGRTLINTLVNPGRPIPWYATKVHGISDSMVRFYPSLNELMPRITEIVKEQELVIYNAAFDIKFFPGELQEASHVHCAMRHFTQVIDGQSWRKLDYAAICAGHVWTGNPHRALADALACRSVWHWANSPVA